MLFLGCSSVPQPTDSPFQKLSDVANGQPVIGIRRDGDFALPILGRCVLRPGVYYVQRSITVREALKVAGGEIDNFSTDYSVLGHRGNGVITWRYGRKTSEEEFLATTLSEGDLVYASGETY